MQVIAEKRAMCVNPSVVLGVPGINMGAEDGVLVVEVLLPEFREDEVTVTSTNEGLDISAVRSAKTTDAKKGRQSYWRHITLPEEAKPEAMKQGFHGGKLKVTMPVGAPLNAVEKELMRRKEFGHDLHEVTPKAERAKTLVFRDPKFPNHWTRYHPVR